MHLMHTSARPISTPPTCTSRPAFNYYKMGKHLPVLPTRATLPYPKMCIPRLTSLRRFMAPLLLNGVPLNLSSPLKVLLRQPWRLVGTVLWPRSVIQACHLSS